MSNSFRLSEPPTDLSEEQINKLYEAAYRATLDLAESGALSPQALAGLRERIDSEIREDIRLFQQQTNNKHKVDCAPGCNHCCTIPVAAYPHEIFAMLAWVEKTYDQGTIDVLADRAVDRNNELLAFTPETRLGAGVLCAMNGPDGSCMAYQAHPFPCAQYTSHDVGKCRYAAGLGNTYAIYGLGRQYDAFASVSEGMRDAMYDAGYPIELVEINAAVAAYFETPDAWVIWAEERRQPFPSAVWRERGSKWGDGVPIHERTEELVLEDAQ